MGYNSISYRYITVSPINQPGYMEQVTWFLYRWRYHRSPRWFGHIWTLDLWMDQNLQAKGKAMSCLPPMTGNGYRIPPIKGRWLGDGLWLFYHVLPTLIFILEYKICMYMNIRYDVYTHSCYNMICAILLNHAIHIYIWWLAQYVATQH